MFATVVIQTLSMPSIRRKLRRNKRKPFLRASLIITHVAFFEALKTKFVKQLVTGMVKDDWVFIHIDLLSGEKGAEAPYEKTGTVIP